MSHDIPTESTGRSSKRRWSNRPVTGCVILIFGVLALAFAMKSVTASALAAQISASDAQAARGGVQTGDEKYEAANGAFKEGRQVEALEYLRRSAHEGNSKAQNRLGYLHFKGQYVPLDHNEAVKWWRRAAEQRHAPAQDNLGMLYATGKGVPLDYAESVKWHRLAAEQGFRLAQYNLGVRYLAGEGVPRDYSEAAKWFREAAEQGYAPAQENLAGMYFEGKGVALDHIQAAKWYRRAAEQGNPGSQLFLGSMYYNGQGVSLDYTKAALWFRKAADQGEEIAHRNLLALGDRQARLRDLEQTGHLVIAAVALQTGQFSMAELKGRRVAGFTTMRVQSVLGNFVIYTHSNDLLDNSLEAQIAVERELGRLYLLGERMSAEDLYVIEGARNFATVLGSQQPILVVRRDTKRRSGTGEELGTVNHLSPRMGVAALCGELIIAKDGGLKVSDLQGKGFQSSELFAVESISGQHVIYGRTGTSCQIAVVQEPQEFYPKNKRMGFGERYVFIGSRDFQTILGDSKMLPIFRRVK